MSRREKQRAQLSTIEAELRRRLVDALKRVARGEDSLFFTTVEFNPFSLPAHVLSKNSAELSELALKSLRLRDILGERATGSVGEMLRAALRDAACTADHNRLGPQRLAAKLLDELGRSQPADADSRIIVRLEPVSGWARFSASEALLDYVAEHLSSWQYLNFTSDTSTWENPDDGCLVNIALASTASVCELLVAAPDASALSSQSVSSLLEHLRDAHGVVVQP
jgi:hypothetical protein